MCPPQATCNADWWLGDPFSAPYRAAARALETHWGTPPMFVREGGSMRVTSLLVKALGVPAMHLPAGQSSDGAHLQVRRSTRVGRLGDASHCACVCVFVFRVCCDSP